MENPDVFRVGQLAEMRTNECGFRGAWFRCTIKAVLPHRNKILLEYCDFEEAPSWVEIYQVPKHGNRSRHIRKQLMVRPQYPAAIVIDGSWKVGDLVDWFANGCYWSARIVKVLSEDKVQIELPMPPSGEGGLHDALCNDLRPLLNWSEAQGWSLPTVASGDSHLIFPTNQGPGPLGDPEQTEDSSDDPTVVD